jgi:hypothetical protein
VLVVRAGEKEHVYANGQPAHPEGKRIDMSDEAKDWVYEKVLSSTSARTSIDGTVFICAVCSCLVADVVAAGKEISAHNASATPVPCLAPVSPLVAHDVCPTRRRPCTE